MLFSSLISGYLYPKENSVSSKCLSNYHRPAPIIWERPHFQQWEPDPSPPSYNYNYNYHGSRDELHGPDYHAYSQQQHHHLPAQQQRRHHHHHQSHQHHYQQQQRINDFYRYDSDGMLNATAGAHENNGRFCNRYISKSIAGPQSCCSCDCPTGGSYSAAWDKKYQVHSYWLNEIWF